MLKFEKKKSVAKRLICPTAFATTRRHSRVWADRWEASVSTVSESTGSDDIPVYCVLAISRIALALMFVYWTYGSTNAKFTAKQAQCLRLRLKNWVVTSCGALSSILIRRTVCVNSKCTWSHWNWFDLCTWHIKEWINMHAHVPGVLAILPSLYLCFCPPNYMVQCP